MSATSDTKYEFYENLAAIIRSIPNNEQLILLGDFNARVGADHDTWPSCIGQFGVGKINENGHRLLELCTYHELCIANSYFRTKPQHKLSWRHPRSKHWHQLDLVITQACLSQERSTRTLLPHCGLQHRPLIVVLQDQAASKEVPSHKETGEPPY